MAVVNNLNQDTSNGGSAAPGIQDNTNTPKNISGSEAGYSGSAPPPSSGSTAAPAANFSGNTSGRFTNLKDYLNANQGYNASGGGLAGQVSSNVQNQANTVQSGYQTDLDKTNKDIQSHTTTWSPENQKLISDVVANPTAYTNNANVSNLVNAKYTGPNQVDNLGTYQQQAGNIAEQAKLANGSAADTQTLLSQLYGQGGNYTPGEQKLDNLLLRMNPNQMQALGGISGISGNLGNTINSGESTVEAAAKQAATATNNASTQAQTNLQTGLTGIQNNIGDALKKALATQGQYNNDLGTVNQELAAGKFDVSTAHKLGLDTLADANGQIHTYGVNDINKYFLPNAGVGVPSAASVATQDQAARVNALSGLLGKGQLYDMNTVGGYKPGSYGFNTEGYKNAISAGKEAYDDRAREATASQQGDVTRWNNALNELNAGHIGNPDVAGLWGQYSVNQSAPAMPGPFGGIVGTQNNGSAQYDITPQVREAILQKIAQSNQGLSAANQDYNTQNADFLNQSIFTR